jgi:hypothetical protein
LLLLDRLRPRDLCPHAGQGIQEFLFRFHAPPYNRATIKKPPARGDEPRNRRLCGKSPRLSYCNCHSR